MTHLLLLRMSFLVSQTVVVLVDIMLRLALYYEPYAREYKDGGDGLHTLEYGETNDDTHSDRYQRLYIVIYTHHGRAQRLLANHHAKKGFDLLKPGDL